MKKLIIKTGLCPGDLVMLTAAIRDLHATYPGEYLTDVRTPHSDIWENNPLITPIADEDGEVINAEYTDSINQSSQLPYHFIHGYRKDLEKKIGRPIKQGAFKGDIYLSDEEKSWKSQVDEIMGDNTKYWIIVAGGKTDYTAKIWEYNRHQQVVDAYRGKILFVQVGDKKDNHPGLRGVLDLRGKTSIRQLIRLVHHSSGVVCPVTSLMHLSAAVPTRSDRNPLRPCVVIAGGRESAHWEQYPGHKFLDSIGTLPCCASGGCWKSKVIQIDSDTNLCERPVAVSANQYIPACLDRISVDDVVNAINSFLLPVPEINKIEKLEPGTVKSCCGNTAKKAGKTTWEGNHPWGPTKWSQFHRHAVRTNLDPVVDRKWLHNFIETIICDDCKRHFREHLVQLPPDYSSTDAYFAWSVKIHNLVNIMLGKPEFSVEAARKMYGENYLPVDTGEFNRRVGICKGCPYIEETGSNLGPKCSRTDKHIRVVARNIAGTCPMDLWNGRSLPVTVSSPISHTHLGGTSNIGILISTYGSVPYVHLQLESRSRFNPEVKCLVVDDGSSDSQALKDLCIKYGASFLHREQRLGHVPGDMQSFIDGHAWAKQNGVELLIKMSRRWLPTQAWVDDAVKIWKETGAPTLNNVCSFHGFGFRSEVIAMDVKAWGDADALAIIRHKIKSCEGHPPDLFCLHSGVLVEHEVHVAASVAKAKAGWKSDLNYAVWPWMGTSRGSRIPGVLWHETSKAPEYYYQLKAWGISDYPLESLVNPSANLME